MKTHAHCLLKSLKSKVDLPGTGTCSLGYFVFKPFVPFSLAASCFSVLGTYWETPATSFAKLISCSVKFFSCLYGEELGM